MVLDTFQLIMRDLPLVRITTACGAFTGFDSLQTAPLADRVCFLAQDLGDLNR
jgi:carbon starvation protein CstA